MANPLLYFPWKLRLSEHCLSAQQKSKHIAFRHLRAHVESPKKLSTPVRIAELS